MSHISLTCLFILFRPVNHGVAKERLALTTYTVAGGEHGGQFLRHRGAREVGFLPRFRGRHPCRPLLQPPGGHDRLLLLLFRPRLRLATDGALEILVRLVGSEAQ